MNYNKINKLIKRLGGYMSLRAWILLAALLCTALLVYSPHFSYPYPLHVDEWHNIPPAKNLLEGQYNFASNRVFELGFHVFLAFFSKIGFDLVLCYKYLPALFAVASALSLYALVHYLTKSYRASLFSIIFFAALPSNVNLLGLWFAVPLTLSIPMIYLSILLLHKALDGARIRDIIPLCAILLLLFFLHASSGFFVLALTILYLAAETLRRRSLKNPLKILAAVSITLLIPSIAFLLFRQREVSWFLSQLIYPRGWTPIEPAVDKLPAIFSIPVAKFYMNPYFPPVIFGLVPFILSLLGFWYAMKNKKLNILIVWIFYSSLTTFLFVNYDFSPLVPYQRMVYYLMLGLVPLAGIGLERLIDSIARKVRSRKIQLLLCAIILIPVLYYTFRYYGTPYRGLDLYYLIDDEDYAAAGFLAKQPDGKILANPSVATALPALASKDVVAAITAIGDEDAKRQARMFFDLDCNSKRKTIDKYGVKYVYSRLKIDCPYLEEIYSDGRYIYLVK